MVHLFKASVKSKKSVTNLKKFTPANRTDPYLAVGAALGLWELLTRTGILPVQDIPPVSSIFIALFADIQKLQIWSNLGITLISWSVGVLAATMVGIPCGLFLGTSKLGYLIFQPTLEFVRTIPSIAAIPLLILILGIGMKLTIMMVFVGALWPMLIQTMYGVRDIDPIAKSVGRVYGLSKFRIFTKIIIPATLPYIATGMRLAATMGLILAVSASLIAGGSGIGYLIFVASFSSEPTLVYSRIILVGLFGLLVTLSLTKIEAKYLFWYEAYRETHTK